MGYYIQMDVGNNAISADKFPRIVEKLEIDKAIWKQSLEIQAGIILDALREVCDDAFEIAVDSGEDGFENFCITEFTGEKLHDSVIEFIFLVKDFIDDDYLPVSFEVRGEDGASWKWVIDKERRVVHYDGIIEWANPSYITEEMFKKGVF